MRLLELLEQGRVVESCGRDVHLADFGAGVGDFGQGFFLVGRIGLDGLNQVGNQVGTALVGRFDIPPRRKKTASSFFCMVL